MENHFKSCEDFTQKECLPVAAHCYLRDIRLMLRNCTRRIKKRKELITNSSRIIQHRFFPGSLPGLSLQFSRMSSQCPYLLKMFLQALNIRCLVVGPLKTTTTNLISSQVHSIPINVYLRMKRKQSKKCLDDKQRKWYWLLSAALTRSRARKVRHFTGANISDIYHYILSVQKILSTA